MPDVHLVRTPVAQRKKQVERLAKFKKRHSRDADKALDDLTRVVEDGGNVFAQLIDTVEHCSLGQITRRLQEVVGHYRATI
jgi:methylmalonyl-CoA mutase N-terminal domain/subunit